MTTEGTAPREERRVITVLFADLVGFTERSEQLDPEDVRALLTSYYARLRAELEAHGGVVDKFIGDAVMAVFGAPVAHEDDPERAVRAALAIRDWARSEDDVSLRIGVNTGEALVALEPAESGVGMVAGDMVNTASRLQSASATDGVLVGESTYRATSRVFAYEERPAISAKGKSEPVRVWEPLHASVGIGEGRGIGDAPLVGRAVELGLLRAAFERARAESEPQLVTLVGVPGIGKTRLVAELGRVARDTDPGLVWLEGRSLAYGAGSSFWGLGEMVKAQAEIMETDPAATAEDKLRTAVEALADEESDARWIEGQLRPLVGLTADPGTREEGQAEAFAAWRRFFELLARRSVLVLVFDDLHWADDAVLAFVDDLVDRLTGVPVLVLATARPELLERHPGWGGGKANAATISLPPLADSETVELVRALASGVDLGADAETAVLARAAGNPLYAEEFVRMSAERRADPGAALPESVQGIVAARLDVLAPAEKGLLQDAAVVGQVFWLGTVAQLGDHDPAPLEELLHGLQRKEFVRRAPHSKVAGEAEYTFRHPLIKEVAYEQIPRAQRAAKHRLAASWAEALPADRAEDRADLLADHYLHALDYTRALRLQDDELAARATRALREAGDHARALHSLEAAASRYRRALELSADENERAELGLALAEVELRAGAHEDARSRLGEVLDVARSSGRVDLLGRAALARGGVGTRVGDADEELVTLLEEALAALGDDDPALRARLLARLAVEVYYVPPTSRREELSDEAVRLARDCGAPDALIDALNARHAALWSPDRLDDRLPVARELVELAEQIGDRERSLQARSWLVLDLVESGDLDGARTEVEGYARLAEPLGIPAFAWWVPAWRAMLARVEGRFDDARRLLDVAVEIGQAAGDANARLHAEILGWHTDVDQGRDLEAWLPMLEAGIERRNAAGAFRCGVAMNHAVSGRLDESRKALDALGPDGFASVPRDMNWYSGAAQFAMAVGMLGDAERASRAYDVIAPFAGRNCLTARAATMWGPVDAFLGRLAATAGRLDEAEAHFRAGIDAAERMFARTSATRTRAWYAQMLRARGGDGDAEHAAELERRVVAEAEELGLALPELRSSPAEPSVQERA